MENREDPKEEGLIQEQVIVVDPGQAPLRIDKFIMSKTERLSRHKIQLGIKAGMVTVDGQVVKSNFKVKPHQTIKLVYVTSPLAGMGISPEDIPLDVRYEDDDLLIVHKPPGMVVHPGIGNHSGTLVNALAHYLQRDDLPILPGNLADRPGLVHRIDKDTSGLLVIAKNEDSLTHLAKQFYDHSIQREYHALVWSTPSPEKGTIDTYLGRHPNHRMLMHVFEEGDGGKHAITHYEVLEDLYYVSLVKCRLETGRTHQIRAHMQYIGHPLFNDNKYQGDRIRKGTVYSKYKQFVQNCFKLLPRHALHAKSLGFIHPSTGEEMFFDSEIPDDMNSVIDKWRNYIQNKKDN